MTYCVGVLLDSGLVLASDSRTNAGVDHIGTFRKMTVFERPGDRVLVMLSSGNLSVTQSVVNLLEQWTNESRDNLWNAPSMYQATCLVGEALREVQKRDGPYLMPHNIDTTAGFILEGRLLDRSISCSTFTHRVISLKPHRTHRSFKTENSSTASPFSIGSSRVRPAWLRPQNVSLSHLIQLCAATSPSACRLICYVMNGTASR